jgi:hypothetical protein
MIVVSGAPVLSRWVEREVNAAWEREQRQNRLVLFPIRRHGNSAPEPWAAAIRRSPLIGDFGGWKDHDSYQKAFQHHCAILLRDRPLSLSRIYRWASEGRRQPRQNRVGAGRPEARGRDVGQQCLVPGRYHDVDMEHVSARLARAVDAAEIMLRRVSAEESGRPVLPGGWSRKQVLGHLIESASNNHQRFVRAALADTLEFPAYDTPGSVRTVAAQSAAWPMLVDLWASYNRYLVHVILHLPTAKLDVVCRIGSNAPVSLRHLAQDYVEHLVLHLRQIGIATPS